MCGIMLTTGKPGDGPTKVGAPYVDFATGMNAAMAVTAGLMEMRRTGEAVQIDVAMLDTALMLMASLITQNMTTDWVPTQNGNEAWSASPSSGAFETADGMLMLAANNEAQFRKLCRAIGRSDIREDPRWESPLERRENGAILRQTLEAEFLTKSADHWESVLEQADVPAARVRRLDETLGEPQISARDLTSDIRVDGYDGPIHVPNMSFRVNGESVGPQTPPSTLGGDTDAVLGELGVDPEHMETLKKAGVI